MSKDNFRDMYSARREGTLELGLVQAFDERLGSDPDFREDYDAFVQACDGLDLGAKETITTPDWLSARILDRLEILPTTAARSRPAWLSLRSLGFAGLGAVALLGAVFTVARRGDGAVATAGVVGGNPVSGDAPGVAGDALRPVIENGRVYIDLQSPGAHSVSILAGPDGALLKRFRIDGQRLHSELVNARSDPYAFEIRVDREPRPLLVILPGTDRSASASQGTGDLVLFAKALSRTYGVPVSLHVATPKTAVSWKFDGAQA
ncbi:hypothetical protein EON81_27130, partial [bacterium]